jgi:CRISPR-associated protein Csb2
MKATGLKVPEWLSGHQPDGRPSLKPHVAFFPLPFVGARYADGHLMGLAMAIPREIDSYGETKEDALRRVIGSLLFREDGEEKTIRLWRTKGAEVLWEWRLKRETGEYPPNTLRTQTWTGPSAEWGSVTPVVLHHYPKRGRDNDVEKILFQAFDSAGLPRPVAMRITPVSVFEGAGHVRSMPEFTEGGEKLCRHQVHVVVRFPSRVEGPVLVGRGRFRGYGLLRPVEVQHG